MNVKGQLITTLHWLREMARGREWMWQDVALPALASRLGLLLVGWFSQIVAVDPNYPWKQLVKFSSHYLLNIWARWDASWYMSIIKDGYSLEGGNGRTAGNVAFFPLYPYLIKILSYLLPAAWRKESVYLLIGVLLSNLLFLAALLILYKLLAFIDPDAGFAQRVILYICFFPTSFYFSAFYTESLYLFLSVGAFYAAHKRVWWLAGVTGFLAALSRPVGALIFLPLVWLYFDSIEYKLPRMRLESGWLLLVPAGLFTFAASIAAMSHDLFSVMKIQSSFGRGLTPPWEFIFTPVWYNLYIGVFQKLAVFGYITLCILAFFFIRQKAYAVYALSLVILPLFSGTATSIARYGMVAFPFFIVLAYFGRNKSVDKTIQISFLLLQGLFMVAWSQFYPII